MRAAVLLGFLATICTCTSNAQTCANVPSRPHDNDKKYEAKKLAGDKAFREGKYDRAAAEYRQALAYQDEAGAYDVFFKLGETHAMLGKFDKAYSCIIESGPGKVPAHRVVAAGFADPRAQQAAQILLDTIQVNTQRYPYVTYPEYFALAAIFRRAGLAEQAESAQEEGRISRQAADAWAAALVEGGSSPSLAAADLAAMEVYKRAHRSEPAEILRVQAAVESPMPRRKRSFWYLLVTANL
jgi:tetratricopeptide (TPR) repeat protein